MSTNISRPGPKVREVLSHPVHIREDGEDGFSLLSLPTELLERVALAVVAGLDGPAHLARLSLTCTQLRRQCSKPQVVTRNGLDRGQAGVETVEQLAVLEAIRNLVPEGTVKIIFMGADIDIRPGSLARLGELRALMARHERLSVEINAHTGRYAPPMFAPRFTRMRACQVMRRLSSDEPESQSDLESRVSILGWGKDVAVAAGWEPGVDSARAELFFSLGGLTIPTRPSYYNGLTVPEDMLQDDFSDGSEEDDGSDDGEGSLSFGSGNGSDEDSAPSGNDEAEGSLVEEDGNSEAGGVNNDLHQEVDESYEHRVSPDGMNGQALLQNDGTATMQAEA